MSLNKEVSFSHAERGLTRFLPNVEQVTVEGDSGRVRLSVRRNENLIRLPLNQTDVEHLVVQI